MAKKVNQYDITPIQENNQPIVIGSKVKLEDSNKIGEVKELRKGKAVVQFGNLMTTFPINKLIHCVPQKAVKQPKSTPSKNNLVEKTKFNLELDLRGKYKDEAMLAIEQFLDRAVQFGVEDVRIIHGKGSGVLRQTVKNTLRQYPYVTNFQHERIEAGGDGVTLVELK